MNPALLCRLRRRGARTMDPTAYQLPDVDTAYGTAITPIDTSTYLGAGPYSLADEYDAIIDGLTLNPTTGVLSGTPTDRRGRGPHEIRVQDAVGNTAGMRMSSIPDINPANYATAFDGTVINTEQTVSGGTGDLLLANLEINDRLTIHSWTGGIVTIYNPTVDTEAADNDGIRVATSGNVENLTIYGGTFNTGLNGIIVAEDTGVTHPGLRILNTRMIATGLSEGPTNKHGIYNQAPGALLEGNSFGPDDDYPSAAGMHWGSGISTRSGSVVRGNRIRQCKNDGIGYYADHPGAGTSLLVEQNDIDSVGLGDSGRSAINLIALNAGSSPPAIAANLIDDATIRNNVLGPGNSIQVAADYASDGVTVTQENNVIVAPTEVWPPSGSPDLYFDFDLGEGYWGGAAKVRSDFIIDVDDGLTSTYRVAWGDLGIPAGEDFTMMVEIDNDALAPEATTASELMGFKVSSSVYNYMRFTTSSQPRGYNAYGIFAHLNPTASTNVSVWNLETGTDTAVAQGRQRIIGVRENGVKSRMISSQGKLMESASANTNTDHPSNDKFLYINQQPSTYGTAAGTPNTSGLPIRRVAFWGRALSEAEMFTISRFGRPGILFLGDSFVAGGNLRQEFVKTVEALGKGPVAAAYDGVGGTGLTAHAVRYASRPEFWPEYLVIMDGGFETGDGIAAAKAAIDSILGNLPHDNWVFVEPNPINPIGDSRRDEWNDFFYGAADNTGARELYNYIGADHYIKTYDTMLAAGDGTTEDNAAIASGLWPASTTGDGTHLNDKGLAIFGGLLAFYAIENKWV